MQIAIGVFRSKWALWALALLFNISFASFLATTALTYDLLEPDYYSSALADNDAYDRFYTQLLADPQFSDLTRTCWVARRLATSAPSPLRLCGWSCRLQPCVKSPSAQSPR